MRSLVLRSLKLGGVSWLLVLAAGHPVEPSSEAHPTSPVATRATPAFVAARARALPMRFEQNVGQVDGAVRFVARSRGATLFLSDAAATLRLPGSEAPLTMKVAGGRRVAPRAEARLVTRSNYLLGKDPTKWHTDVPNFGRVIYPGVLDGVDLVYHGEEGQLEYDFVVAPGSDPGRIALEVGGAEGLSLTASGELVIRTRAGGEGRELVQPRPRVFQRDAIGNEHDVVAGYRLVGEHAVAFAVTGYDPTRELVIDPVLSYATYLGGAADEFSWGIAVTSAGAAYATGWTTSLDYPTQGPYQATRKPGSSFDAFVSKLNPAGDALEYSTYLGGGGADLGQAIAVDAAGSAYVGGYTTSADFPTASAFQSAKSGGTGTNDGFVVKLSPAGNALTFATYLGGTQADTISAIAIDAAGSAYVTGSTESVNFPLQDPFLATKLGMTDVFVTKFAPSGASLAFSTLLTGASYDHGSSIAVDADSNVYVGGTTSSANFPIQGAYQATIHPEPFAIPYEGFVTKLNPAGSALVYSTYLGGAVSDNVMAIAVDAARSVYVTGRTYSVDFPTKDAFQPARAGADDVFVSKLSPAGDALVYSTYLGGAANDLGRGIAVDSAGNAYVAGETESANFPLKSPLQATYMGRGDVFVTKLGPTGGALVYSTYLGGAGWDRGFGIDLDGTGSAYVAGYTNGSFPTQSAFQPATAGGVESFLLKIATPALTLAPVAVTLPPGGAQTFVASGGSGVGYVYALRTNASGGAIDPASGAYSVGATSNVSDVVEVADSEGTTATATVTVTTNPVDAGPEAGPSDGGGDASPPDAAIADAAVDAGPRDAALPVTPDGALPAVDAGTGPGVADAESCSCRTTGGPPSRGAAGAFALVLGALLLRRSRREERARG